MSKIDGVEIEAEDELRDSLTDDLRSEEPAEKMFTNPLKSFVKPVIHADEATTKELEGVFTSEQVIAISKAVEAQTRKTVAKSVFDANMAGQVIPKSAVPITDFSKLNMDAVYDLSIPIEAKEFMSADALTIHLADTNYEARWVNKNPRNLGDKIAKGFTYIVPADLQNGNEEAIKAAKDAQGHYVFDDVVAMKIDKATYYAALRKAHLRAISTTNEVTARERAAKTANAFMEKSDVSADFNNARAQRKMVFYDPGIGA